MSAMGMGDLASNLRAFVPLQTTKMASFFGAFAAMAVKKSLMTLLILDLLHQNLRYHFSPKTTAGGETL